MQDPISPRRHDQDEAIRAWCVQRPLRLCVLFGSRARGSARPDSDVDLAIWPRGTIEAARLLEWHRELSEISGLEVQIAVITPELDPVLAMEIARDGRALFESERGSWTEARVRLWQSYQDALPFLRLSRQRLRKFSTEVRNGT
ncbi:MAG: nucleotidyltransferase domain-containing protein [Thermoanaerobaculia bacterium]